jgi:hypothetical protein
VSNTKSKSVTERLPLVQASHQKLALLVSRPPPNNPAAVLDPRWGRFLATHRFNLDQVGIPFVGALGPTFEFIGTAKRLSPTTIQFAMTPTTCSNTG